MHESTAAPAAVIFGLDPMWFAAILFILTYAVIVTERINRAVVALLGAGLMIFGRRAQPGRGLSRHRLQHHRPADRHDGHRRHHPEERRVPVRGGLVGQKGQGRSRGACW